MSLEMKYKNESLVFKNLGHVYEFLAQELGYKDWNTLCGTSVREAFEVKRFIKDLRIRGLLKKRDEA